MHWTYESFADDFSLRQGDILEPTQELVDLFQEVHPHFTHEKYRAFLILTQTCDLAKHNGKCSATHISLSVIRSLQDIINDSLKDRFCVLSPGIYESQRKVTVENLAERLVNQNENALGLFYLHPDSDAGIYVPCVAILRVSISIKALHYPKLIEARVGRLSTEFQPKLGWMVGNLYSRVGVTDWKEKKAEENYSGKDEGQIINEILSDTRRDQPVWLEKKVFKKIIKAHPDFGELEPGDQDAIIERYRPTPPKDEIIEIIINKVSNVVPKFKDVYKEQLKYELEIDDVLESKLRKFGQ